jgi:hypothetical protein
MQPTELASTTRRRCRRLVPLALLVAVALLSAACGSDSDDTESSPRAASTTTGTTTTARPPASGRTDATVARAALLTADDLHDGWEAGPRELVFPNSAALARTVPACAEFAELVFDGGAKHGKGMSGVVQRQSDLLFSYVVVFPTPDEAAAMVKATADPDFDRCWAAFNAVAIKAMPLGVTSASYRPADPPHLTIEADELDVEALTGSIQLGGSTLADTCVCLFAQVGRGVVELHATEPTLDPAARSKAAQTAIDKLRTTLTAA